jgi:prolipoprotein diacylglyceryltransferase
MRPHVVSWLERYLRGDLASLLAPSWFTCVGLAGLVALAVMLVLARRRGIDPGTVASVVLWGYVAAVLAGILVPMTIDAVEGVIMTGQLHLRWSGMTSFWGYLAGGVAVALVCKREGLPLGRIGDLSIIPLGVALVFARLGCFMAGCDYGKVSSVPWAIRFPAGSPAWHDHVHAGLIPADRAASLPVHPTQLYEAVLGLAIVAIAIWVARRARREGDVFLIGAATYAIGRLVVVETLRGDAGRGIYAGLSSGQIFSLLVLVAIAARFVAVKPRAITAAVATALALVVTHVGEARAQLPRMRPPSSPIAAQPSQPFGPPPPPAEPPPPPPAEPPAPPPAEPPPPDPDLDPPPEPQQPLDEQPAPVEEAAPAAFDPTERPLFSTGLLYGVATPLNRRANQIATLTGASASIGWMPGRFGVWLDLDSYANQEASHGTVLAAFSYSYRPTRSLMLGARSGIGLTLVNFKDPAFRDVTGETYRLEAIAEYAVSRHWAVWARPLAIDVLAAPELGGPIMTYQVRIGVAYRFGSRHNAVRPAAPPPAQPPPPLFPTLPPDPEQGAP